MKFILILACLALYVAHSQAQRTSCRGAVLPANRTSCAGNKNEGHARLPNCRRNANPEMWWYDNRSRSCKKMSYRGCGGNENRHCSLDSCRRRCRRRST